MVAYVTPRLLLDFHYMSFMHVDYPKLAYDFQLYVQRFLRFGWI